MLFPFFRNMVLQNESVDDELEHFEDIVEETDNEPSNASKKEENNTDLHGDAANSQSDSSEDEGNLQASYSEDDESDDAEELLIRGDSNNHQKPNTLSDHKVQKTQVPPKRSSLPGGYNPRHREPSYW